MCVIISSWIQSKPALTGLCMELKVIPRHKLRHLAESQCVFCVPLQFRVQQTPLTIIEMKMQLQMRVPKLPRPQNLLLQLVPVVSGVREAPPARTNCVSRMRMWISATFRGSFLIWGHIESHPERMIRTMVGVFPKVEGRVDSSSSENIAVDSNGGLTQS